MLKESWIEKISDGVAGSGMTAMTSFTPISTNTRSSAEEKSSFNLVILEPLYPQLTSLSTAFVALMS